MNKTNLFAIGGIGLIAVIILAKTLAPENQEVSHNLSQTESMTGVANGGSKLDNPVTPSKDSSWYTDYSASALSTATKNEQRTVIFFHANWCPSCLAADKDFEANQSQIPSDVTILRADYDTETELKKKYGIVTQDTFVQIDANGAEVTKWNSGGKGINALLGNLKSV